MHKMLQRTNSVARGQSVGANAGAVSVSSMSHGRSSYSSIVEKYTAKGLTAVEARRLASKFDPDGAKAAQLQKGAGDFKDVVEAVRAENPEVSFSQVYETAKKLRPDLYEIARGA